MKKILFGIAVMLCGWIVEVSLHLELFAFVVAIVGLIFAVVGLVSKENN